MKKWNCSTTPSNNNPSNTVLVCAGKPESGVYYIMKRNNFPFFEKRTEHDGGF